MKSVLGIKLVSGEELISAATENGDYYQLTRPAMLGMVPNSAGSPGVGLIDYLIASSDKTILISKSHVLFVYVPKTEVVNTYNSLYGTGLVMPPSPFTM